jgi:hypothetical protein
MLKLLLFTRRRNSGVVRPDNRLDVQNRLRENRPYVDPSGRQD